MPASTATPRTKPHTASVDTYGRDEELSAFEVYVTDALQPRFATTWRDPIRMRRARPSR
jgi:hypothetical protein